LQLALVAGGVAGIALEIDYDPAVLLDECQVDHAFQQPPVFQAQVDGQLAVAALGGARA
jgi:hypothetical protein